MHGRAAPWSVGHPRLTRDNTVVPHHPSRNAKLAISSGATAFLKRRLIVPRAPVPQISLPFPFILSTRPAAVIGHERKCGMRMTNDVPDAHRSRRSSVPTSLRSRRLFVVIIVPAARQRILKPRAPKDKHASSSACLALITRFKTYGREIDPYGGHRDG